LLSPCLSLFAQERIITGKVTNQETTEALEGVTVSSKGTNKTSITDSRGEFTIKANRGDSILVFSHVGFADQQVRIGEKTLITIALIKSNKQLDDVVVIAYGTQKKSDVLGAVVTFNPKEVVDLPTANMSTALKGMISGVGISQTSGKPGATTTISIRGATTFASNGNTSPLFVIDGLVPIIASSGSVDPTGKTAFDALDPSQVESITFLKDAAATIYGARGANGVVLVTTKRGKPGKPRLSYSGSYSTESPSKVPDMISGYDQALLLNNWVQNYKPSAVVPTEVYTPAELDSIKAHNYNWFTAIWKPASIERHTLTISGGSDKLTFFAGGNYYSEKGNLNNVTAKSYGLRLGMNAKIANGLTADMTLGIDNAFSNRPAPKGTTTSEQSDQLNATVGGLLSVPGWVPTYYQGNPVYYAPLAWSPDALNNSGSYNNDRTQTLALNASLNYMVPAIKGLVLRAQYGRNTYTDFSKQYYVSYLLDDYVKSGVHTNIASGTNKATGTQNVIWTPTINTVQTIKNGNSLSEIWNNSANWQATEGVGYTNQFGQHNINVLLLAEQSQTTADYLTSTDNTQVVPGVDQIFGFSADPTQWGLAGQSSSTGRVSYMGRLTYSYKNKYLLEGAFRDDASPNFPYAKQWGFFPSVSVGWKVSEENFFRDNVHFINDLKLRYNMGLTGNDAVSAFSFLKRYTTTSYGYLFGSTVTNGLQSSVIPNADITWERALFKDLGIDGTFLNRKFNFTIDGWYKHQFDMLETPNTTVPNTFGGSIADQNHGILNSWGLETSVGYNAAISSSFHVFATVNFGMSDNKVINKYYNLGTDTGYKYPIGKRSDQGITAMEATGIVRTQADVNAFYAKNPGWTINGDSLRVGDLNYKDIDGDGKITSNDVTQIVARAASRFGASFTVGFTWKTFRFSTNLSLSAGGYTVWKKLDIAPPTKDVRSLDMWKNSYTAANPDAPLPAIYSPLVNQASSYWLHSATSLYVNNMQLSYSLPADMVTRLKMPECRIYITGFNLWNIINPTPFKDSRANTAQDYPILRTFTFGLNVTL
jgi:TonB-linked SusC/RagA family outer membrane protein